jgi:hypothetical protein
MTAPEPPPRKQPQIPPADLQLSLYPDLPGKCGLFLRKNLPADVGLKIIELVRGADHTDP